MVPDDQSASTAQAPSESALAPPPHVNRKALLHVVGDLFLRGIVVYSAICWVAFPADVVYIGLRPLSVDPLSLPGVAGAVAMGVYLTPLALLIGIIRITIGTHKRRQLVRAGVSPTEAEQLVRPYRRTLAIVAVPVAVILVIWLVALAVLTGGGKSAAF
jgi:hypothetical protein